MSSFHLFHYRALLRALRGGCDSMSSFHLFHWVLGEEPPGAVVIRCLPSISSTPLARRTRRGGSCDSMSSFHLFHWRRPGRGFLRRCDSMSSFHLFHSSGPAPTNSARCDSMSSFHLFHYGWLNAFQRQEIPHNHGSENMLGASGNQKSSSCTGALGGRCTAIVSFVANGRT